MIVFLWVFHLTFEKKCNKMKKSLKIKLLGLICLFQLQTRFPQHLKCQNEIGFSVGFSNFLGDLGGANQNGRPLFWDIDPQVTRPAIGILFAHSLNSRFSLRVNAYVTEVRGDDALTNDAARNYRNLHFKSTIFEVSAGIEFNILKFIPDSHNKRFAPYLFVGIGVFYYNPKAKYDSEWVELRPLGTEGQGSGQYPERRTYSSFNISFPIGIGVKYAINERWTLGFEFAPRFTLTDYLDDVSTSYVEPEIFYNSQNHGEASMAAFLADPSSGDRPRQTTPGAQRGNPKNKDAYIFGGLLSIKYRLGLSRGISCPVF
jgi:opacity protein-like surface antigen